MAITTDLEAGHVNVGDTKTLEVFAEDSSDTELPDPEVEVTVTSPSGAEQVYTNNHLTESGRRYFLDFEFTEPGYWHVHIKVTSAGATEAESGFVRAITREPADLSLLTRDVWHEHLSEEAMEEGPDVLFGLIDEAERKVLNRYREVAAHPGDLILDAHYDSNIRLDGYVEDSNGNPDLQEMDSGLLGALRASIANIVEFWVDRPDEAEHIESVSQGDRSVSYRDGDLPPSVYSGLRPYDRRAVWH